MGFSGMPTACFQIEITRSKYEIVMTMKVARIFSLRQWDRRNGRSKNKKS